MGKKIVKTLQFHLILGFFFEHCGQGYGYGSGFQNMVGSGFGFQNWLGSESGLNI